MNFFGSGWNEGELGIEGLLKKIAQNNTNLNLFYDGEFNKAYQALIINGGNLIEELWAIPDREKENYFEERIKSIRLLIKAEDYQVASNILENELKPFLYSINEKQLMPSNTMLEYKYHKSVVEKMTSKHPR